jgi:hypothetical protein
MPGAGAFGSERWGAALLFGCHDGPMFRALRHGPLAQENTA